MSRPSPSHPLATVFFAAFAGSAAAAASAAPPVAAAAKVTFVEATATPEIREDRQVTAIGLRAVGPETPAIRCTVVLLVDTSASQAGEHRQKSLQALAGLLGKARPEDRFLLEAIDVTPVRLSRGFSAAGDAAVRNAVQALESRTPLGSTDLVAGLLDAAELFETTGAEGALDGEARRIVYIGDGPTAGAIDTDDFRGMLDTLRAKRISVSAIGFGDRINWPCLAAIANATGGSLVIPEPPATAAEAGERMADRAIQPVVWAIDAAIAGPDNASPEGPAAPRLLPEFMPPLRHDRDTVVLVDGPLSAGRLTVEAAASEQSGQARRIDLAIDVPGTVRLPQNAYLGELVRNASPTGGIFLPTLGREGLELSRAVIREEARVLAGLGQQAEAMGDRAAALRLARASLRRDPDNIDASLVQTAAKRPDDAGTDDVFADDPISAEELPPGAAPPRGVPPAGFDPAPAVRSDSQELLDAEKMRRVRAERLEQETAVRLRNARLQFMSDPAAANRDLKDLLIEIRESDDLDNALRERLSRQVEMRIREASVREKEKVAHDLACERSRAAAREKLQLIDDLNRREERFASLVKRYHALVEEGIRVGYAQAERYPTVLGDNTRRLPDRIIAGDPPTTAFTEAERVVGEAIQEAAPNLYANYGMPMTAREIGVTAPLVARILDYDSENYRTRRDHERGFMDALHLVDVSGIPFPDDPPIIYPSARRWRDLTEARKKYRSVDTSEQNSPNEQIRNKLDRSVTNWKFPEGSTLRDVKVALEDGADIPVVIDTKALDEAGLAEDLEIAQNLKDGISYKSALRLTLGNVGLTYIIKDDVLRITTKEAAELETFVRVYPVADLVLPINMFSGPNPFSLGGGQGQGGAAMNQAAGGAAAGGGGLGGGGLGGFCWVAREVYGVADGRWLVFRSWLLADAPAWLRELYAARGESFAEWVHDKPLVKFGLRWLMDRAIEGRLARDGEDPSEGAKGGQFQVADAAAKLGGPARLAEAKTSEAEAPRAAPATGAVSKGLPAAILQAADLQAAIAAYLDAPAASSGRSDDAKRDATRAERMAELRATSLQLGEKGLFDQATALLSAAITTGHVEPWMYESLAASAELSGASKEEVERILLSGCDFADDATSLLALAEYLARMGSDRQAIAVCRRVTRIDPECREAFALAMTLAAKSDDARPLAWACAGVLAHDWPAGQSQIAARAARLAKATIDRLSTEGRNDEAKAFRTAIDEALVRDVEVTISWEGDADIDLYVEEPTGSVCAPTFTRSDSGGTLLVDADATSPQSDTSGNPDIASQSHRERYVCSRAFAGPYRVLLRKVWGEVAGGAVTAEIVVHRGTNREERLRQQVPLGTTDALLTFALPDGRRTEPLEEATIAHDVAAQRTIGRAALAQRLSAINDPSTSASLARSRVGVATAGAAGLPFFRSGAAGYQPIISTLPDGTNMRAIVAISADRRYVRISVSPIFSSVGQVTQFNFTGAGARGTGGAGGGGGMGGGGMGGGGMGGGGMGGGGMGGGGMGGGGMGGGGMGGGGMGGGGFCWVARTVYGENNPRWLLFRDWLANDAPRWLHDLYAGHGERFAAWIADKPLAKACVRGLMDAAINGRFAEVPEGPCPLSE